MVRSPSSPYLLSIVVLTPSALTAKPEPYVRGLKPMYVNAISVSFGRVERYRPDASIAFVTLVLVISDDIVFRLFDCL
jgi:hypothetical protein